MLLHNDNIIKNIDVVFHGKCNTQNKSKAVCGKNNYDKNKKSINLFILYISFFENIVCVVINK